jgi:type IV pilus assembly protein PilE
MKKSAGFTLTELLIVIVIAAILASIAVPSYREAVRRSDRRAAQAAMMEIANREQQYFLANRVYADEEEIGFTLPTELQDKYSFEIDVELVPPYFEITFTPKGPQAGDGVLTLDSTGRKTGKW